MLVIIPVAITTVPVSLDSQRKNIGVYVLLVSLVNTVRMVSCSWKLLSFFFSSRYLDKWGPGLQTKISWALRASAWSKNKGGGGGAGRAPPLDLSLQMSINLGNTFRRISRIRNTPLTWILVRVFAYLSSFISQILYFIYWTVLIFILICFERRDTENQQYLYALCTEVQLIGLTRGREDFNKKCSSEISILGN